MTDKLTIQIHRNGIGAERIGSSATATRERELRIERLRNEKKNLVPSREAQQQCRRKRGRESETGRTRRWRLEASVREVTEKEEARRRRTAAAAAEARSLKGENKPQDLRWFAIREPHSVAHSVYSERFEGKSQRRFDARSEWENAGIERVTAADGGALSPAYN